MGVFRRIRPLLGVLAVATAAALLVRLLLLEDFRIASNSMQPTLLEGDLVFVNKLAFNIRLPFSHYELLRLREPRRGEVVAFTLPGKGMDTVVKRVVALAGDQVEIRKGRLYLNGEPVKRIAPDSKTLPRQLARFQPKLEMEEVDGHLYPILEEGGATRNYGPIHIPPGHFFVLGDNRAVSEDSRAWGPVPYSYLKGRLSLVWLSLEPGGGLRHDRLGTVVR